MKQPGVDMEGFLEEVTSEICLKDVKTDHSITYYRNKTLIVPG